MKDATISHLLQDIRAAADGGATVDDLLKKLHHLAALAPLSIGSGYGAGSRLYRGTNHHRSIPSRIEEIWYPPAQRLNTFGRANRPGSPMLYCCSEQTGAFREISIKVGQYALLATWETTRLVIVHDLGFSAEVFQRANSRRALPERYAAFDGQYLSPTAREVRDFLALAFTEPGTQRFPFTTAIAELFLEGDHISGIVYPAVSRSANVDNFALRPQFVNDGLRLVNVDAILVDEEHADEAFGGTVVARLLSCVDGKLQWEYTGTQRDLPIGETLYISAGESLRITQSGVLVFCDQKYAVEPGYAIRLINGKACIVNLHGSVVERLPEE